MLLILLETLHHSDTHTHRIGAEVQHQRAQCHSKLHCCCGVGGLARGWGLPEGGVGARLLVVMGGGSGPVVRGGLRGPGGLLVTAGPRRSLPLIIDCSSTLHYQCSQQLSVPRQQSAWRSQQD